MEEIVNRVAQSSIKTINLEKWFPTKRILAFNLMDYLYEGLILKEKDFRASLQNLDWSAYEGAMVYVYCSADAIVPTWAYMLVGSYLSEVSNDIYYGDQSKALEIYYRELIYKLDLEEFKNEKVIIKGCSNKPVPNSAYLDLTVRLKPIVQSLMFGEACSSVPIYKKKKTQI